MFSALTVRVRNTHPIVVHTSQELCLQQMVRHQTLLAPVGEATKQSHQLCLTSRKRRSLRTKIERGRNNNNRTWVPHPLKDSILIHHPHLVAMCTHLHYYSSRLLSATKSSCNRTPVLLLHSSRWPSSISNTLRPVETRQKLLRASPVPHPSPPPWAAFLSMMEKTRMDVLNGCGDAKKPVSI